MRHTFLVVKRWLKSVYIYGSCRKIKTGVPLFWTTLYSYNYNLAPTSAAVTTRSLRYIWALCRGFPEVGKASSAVSHFFRQRQLILPRDARSTKRGIAIVSRLSVRLSVKLMYQGRISWLVRKVINRVNSFGSCPNIVNLVQSEHP